MTATMVNRLLEAPYEHVLRRDDAGQYVTILRDRRKREVMAVRPTFDESVGEALDQMAKLQAKP